MFVEAKEASALHGARTSCQLSSITAQMIQTLTFFFSSKMLSLKVSDGGSFLAVVTVLAVASDILDSTEPALALSISTDSSGAASSGLSGVESSCLCSMPEVLGFSADASKGSLNIEALWTYEFSKTRWDVYHRLWLIIPFGLVSKLLFQGRADSNL